MSLVSFTEAEYTAIRLIVAGYWFLENADESAAKSKEYNPPEGLLDFIHKARSEGKKIVYM